MMGHARAGRKAVFDTGWISGRELVLCGFTQLDYSCLITREPMVSRVTHYGQKQPWQSRNSSHLPM
jgi:hypothetical protein